jgi:hypothetical protein
MTELPCIEITGHGYVRSALTQFTAFKSNGDSHNFGSRQAFPQKKPPKTWKKPYPQAWNRSSDRFA